MYPPDIGAGNGPPRGTHIIDYGVDELLILQDSVPNGELTHTVQEVTQHAHPLSSFLYNVIYEKSPGRTLSKGYTQITSGFEQFDWFPEQFYWSRLDESPSGTGEYYRGALRHINGDSPFVQPPLKVVEIRLLVPDEQIRLA